MIVLTDVWVVTLAKFDHGVQGVFFNEEAAFDFIEELCLKTRYRIDEFIVTQTNLYR